MFINRFWCVVSASFKVILQNCKIANEFFFYEKTLAFLVEENWRLAAPLTDRDLLI